MIQVDNLAFFYAANHEAALSRLTFKVPAGTVALLTGPTGCGKSTLLKTINGLAPTFTGGKISGSISIDGQNGIGKKPHELAHLVGYVNQQPENAFATDTVEDELAFGMEQLGFSHESMIARVLETAALVGLSDLLTAPLDALSAGQQQRVAIGAAIAAGQKVLLLDEPTSALDANSASATLQLLKKLAREDGFTIIISEHRVEQVLEIADLVIELDGTLRIIDANAYSPTEPTNSERTTKVEKFEPLMSLELSKKYGEFIALDPMNFNIGQGETIAVLGDNGSGKSSLLWALLDATKNSEVETAMVPQTAADLLFLHSVAAELQEASDLTGSNAASKKLEQLVGRLNPNLHPRDLSAGQQLAMVLAIQMAKGAKLLLLDEPTRGLDTQTKRLLAQEITNLATSGVAIVFATHDQAFAASISNRVLKLDEGRLAHA
ncbi:MAG: ABC transporter ATP-binding protein [Rhodoluna sp.]